MTALRDVLRRVSGRSADLVTRIEGLQQAVESARGRVDDEVVQEVAGVADRAAARLRLSGDHTVVALAGATGSGKSSIFNLITDLDLAAVGVRRPTTSWTLACSWAPAGAGALLDWLGVPPRHQINRMSMLDSSDAQHELEGLVLLDLPDHDSTEMAHRLEVERLVQYADLLVWILDPQKYADAALHERYLRGLGNHQDVTIVVLNHIDELSVAEAKAALGDVRRLLVEDGLESVPLLATSATRGDGIEELRKTIAERISKKRSATARAAADVTAAAEVLRAETGDADPRDLHADSREELVDACADAAGVPVVVEAIHGASLQRSRRATGWPVTKWLTRLRPDPLKRLHLERAVSDSGGTLRAPRSSVPAATPVQRARVDASVREMADRLTSGMPQAWTDAVRSASVSRVGDLTDALDQAVASTDTGISRTPVWWRIVNVLQWLLFVIAVAGGLWLAALAVCGFLRVPQPATPDWFGIPVPTAMLIGGAVVGVVVAFVCRLLSRWSARRRSRQAERRLREAIAAVVTDLVLDPVTVEVLAYRSCRDGIRTALRS